MKTIQRRDATTPRKRRLVGRAWLHGYAAGVRSVGPNGNPWHTGEARVSLWRFVQLDAWERGRRFGLRTLLPLIRDANPSSSLLRGWVAAK
jgi:hypothetical protein